VQGWGFQLRPLAGGAFLGVPDLADLGADHEIELAPA
jgi:hypothetical protein